MKKTSMKRNENKKLTFSGAPSPGGSSKTHFSFESITDELSARFFHYKIQTEHFSILTMNTIKLFFP